MPTDTATKSGHLLIFRPLKANYRLHFFGGGGNSPPVDHGLHIHEISISHTTTRHSRLGSSGRVISSSQRPLPDNTQHSKQTDVHALRGIRTRNLSKRLAADLRLRTRCNWDRRIADLALENLLHERTSIERTVKTFPNEKVM